VIQKKVLIFGAGKRVRTDVLPSFREIGILENLVLVRKTDTKLEEFPNIQIVTEDNFEKSRIREFYLIIFCVAPKTLDYLLKKYFNELRSMLILVDTPVISNSTILKDIDSISSLRILEDNGLIPLRNFLSFDLEKSKIIIIFRALYYYHGMALLTSLFENSELRILRILPKFINQYLTLLKYRSGPFVIWFHFRNYQKSSIFWFTFQDKWQIDNSTKKSREYVFRLEEQISSELMSKFRKLLNDREIIEKSITSNMLYWKRLGLFLGLERLIKSGDNVFPSLESALANELPWLK
jgi:hypothetical protein